MGATEHEIEHVDDDHEGFVLVCSCGWRSDRKASAEAVGHEWDAHRAGGA